jgi:hypothetical protein
VPVNLLYVTHRAISKKLSDLYWASANSPQAMRKTAYDLTWDTIVYCLKSVNKIEKELRSMQEQRQAVSITVTASRDTKSNSFALNSC